MMPARALVQLLPGLFAVQLNIANATGDVMAYALECKVLEVTTAGELRIVIGDRMRTVRLRGVVVPPETASAVNNLLERLGWPSNATRCLVAADDGLGVPPATVEYLAWRDKSGDVWEDFGATLLEQGLARVTAQDGLAIEGYVALEGKARKMRRGLWAREPGP